MRIFRCLFPALLILSALTAHAAHAIDAGKTRELSRGDVRVILLRAENIITTNQEPAFEVTFAVEVPRKGAFADLAFGKIEQVKLSAKGKPITGRSDVSCIAAGIENLPRADKLARPVAQADKSILGEHVQFTGLKVKEKKIDITIQFHWRGELQTFPFESVSIR
jgi:hypothetical protein